MRGRAIDRLGVSPKLLLMSLVDLGPDSSARAHSHRYGNPIVVVALTLASC